MSDRHVQHRQQRQRSYVTFKIKNVLIVLMKNTPDLL
jgi:hypothetical protein